MDDNADFEIDLFWFYSQTFINYAANLSKLLWATKISKETHEEFQNRKKLRDQIRKSIGISENSILKDKKLRNRFEHIDEDIDIFNGSLVMQRNFGPSEGFINLGGKEYDALKEKTFRHYDPYQAVLGLYGKNTNLQDLYNEIKMISERVIEFEEKSSVYPSSKRSRLRTIM